MNRQSPIRNRQFSHAFVWLYPVLLAALVPAPSYAQAVAAAAAGTEAAVRAPLRSWIGQEAAIEEYMRTAEIDRIEEVPVGVTRPKRVYFKPGGPVESVAWKQIPPGIHRGFWDSYKADIAAYELDKLLGMGMVPPAVERRVNRELGAAILWLSPTRVWKDVEKDPKPSTLAWDRQVIRMKMFDNLICNNDRNMGNLLVDADWNLYLIDHSRAFITSKELPVKMNRIDRVLWDRILALDEPALQKALGKWIGKREIRAILERRDRMKKEIAAMVASRGESAVLVQ
jgi:hypothetical protein